MALQLLQNNQSPIGQMLGDLRGAKAIPSESPSNLNYFLDLDSRSRVNANSTAWVMLENSFDFIIDSTQLKSSGSNVIDVRTFLRLISNFAIKQYDSILPQHINIIHTMSYSVILNKNGSELNGRYN